ncbi:carbohydrate porin [Serratia proteamaculans]
MMMKPRYLAVAVGLILSSAAQGADISASAIEARFNAMEKRLQQAESRAAKAEARATQQQQVKQLETRTASNEQQTRQVRPKRLKLPSSKPPTWLNVPKRSPAIPKAVTATTAGLNSPVTRVPA